MTLKITTLVGLRLLLKFKCCPTATSQVYQPPPPFTHTANTPLLHLKNTGYNQMHKIWIMECAVFGMDGRNGKKV